MKKPRISLMMGLLATIVVCWLVPIIVIMSVAGALLGENYVRSAQQEIDTGAQYAVRQVQMHLSDAISTSKNVSYDGIVRSAYRSYLENGDGAQMYRSINDYLSQTFSREDKYKAVFLNFWEESVSQPYVLGSGTTGFETPLKFRNDTPDILEIMADADTQIRFIMLDGELYMARNLLDSDFIPYATIVMMFDTQLIFQPMDALSMISDIQITLGECTFQLEDQGKLTEAMERSGQEEILTLSVDVDGYTFAFDGCVAEFDLWQDNPWLGWSLAAVGVMVLPMLIVVVFMFYQHVTRPINTLAKAHMQVQSGKRGYEIDQVPPNAEFAKLYDHFNSMSAQLRSQFERAYLEQQATQRARIKALQSQINPHFLNNTLEIINWEARIAGNDRVSAMIEALSTMLDAALDRDGRNQIPLREEIGYVDAYLYIIQVRLGDGFRVRKDIESSILDQMIPRLILQPLVENAVEHGITAHHGGTLWVRAYREGGMMVLEVEHDGTMTQEDREKIHLLLSDRETAGSRVGIRNVNERLKLIYGEEGSLSVDQTAAGTVLARIRFPAG